VATADTTVRIVITADLARHVMVASRRVLHRTQDARPSGDGSEPVTAAHTARTGVV
jgi:hypothetical protein